MEHLKNTHDLRLSNWGPYTKKYIGISHIPDVQKGFRFDLSVFPGQYRRRVDVPNVMWESGYHPWEAAPDLSYFCHRHEIEWQDQVYCDVSFSALGENERLIRCECVNRTTLPQNLVLHYMASLQLPPLRVYSPETLRPATVQLPAGAVWIDALDYVNLSFATPRPTDSLCTDGQWRGEVRRHGFVSGNGLGAGFGQEAGDRVEYTLRLPQPLAEAVLLLRYQAAPGSSTRLALSGLAEQTITLPGGEGIQALTVPISALSAGEHQLTLISLGGGAVEIDGLAVVAAADVDAVTFETQLWDAHPEMIPGPLPNSLLLKYRDVETYYGIYWDYPQYEVRQFLTDELDRMMRYTVHNHTLSVLRGSGDGHYANVFLRPIFLEPESSRVLYGLVCSGTQAEVEARIQRFASTAEGREERYLAAKAGVPDLAANPAGERYAFSQERMAATVLSNVVYPVYTKRRYIRHNTPGRWWDCLYTWDSGFVGLGLLELDVERAVDCLNAYTTEPGDPQTAFIHHGSPVPTQFYLFHELWNRTQSPELLAYFYPRLRQYHRFLAGRYGSSTTNTLPSHLIKTWDYFYNSGGWDDYPPQVYVHRQGLEPSVAPASNTAHAIRTARLLRTAALALGETDDLAEYDADIATFGDALQRYAWDEPSGYFGYVCHDDAGRPTGILRHESGVNYNMGLDGAYPLVAGIYTPSQRTRLLSHLMTDGEIWCPIGLSTVDQSAPYFRVDGYWNGAVWMPHQWLFWKALLDLGEADAAERIARTALEVWKREVEASYHCFEHFIVATGRGAGWHQFSGLSSPVLNWYGAYHRPGRLTTGLDGWIVEQRFAEGNRALTARLQLHGSSDHASTVLVTLMPGPAYSATWNGQSVASRERYPGTLEITLPGAGEGVLTVAPLEAHP